MVQLLTLVPSSQSVLILKSNSDTHKNLLKGHQQSQKGFTQFWETILEHTLDYDMIIKGSRSLTLMSWTASTLQLPPIRLQVGRQESAWWEGIVGSEVSVNEQETGSTSCIEQRKSCLNYLTTVAFFVTDYVVWIYNCYMRERDLSFQELTDSDS